MAFIVVRNNSSGYVSCVEKRRVKNPDGSSVVRDVGRVCGLGTMSKAEFMVFRDWAHSIKNQEERKAMVLSSGKAITEKASAAEKIVSHIQKKTTVKAPKKAPTKSRKTVRKHFPVRQLSGYKGRDVGKTHTQIMRERKDARAETQRMLDIKAGVIKEDEPAPRFKKSSIFSPEGIASAKRSKRLVAQQKPGSQYRGTIYARRTL